MLKIVLTSLFLTGTIFIVKEVVPKLKINSAQRNKIIEEMQSLDISFEEAQNNLLLKKLAEKFNVNKTNIMCNSQSCKLGDRISCESYKYGFVSGNFIGSVTSEAEGYGEILIIKSENAIYQMPIEYIKSETILVIKG
ncbi:MAG: hypothetical protein N4A40_12730 [Tissierellales bacterium]|jgi:hypothetical protein|nr:hypothetical protein [Tissierellales bacterium]